MQPPEITLRYFAIRGRAQPLREFLSDAGVAFTDEQVPLAGDWPSRRDQRGFAGPFKALPVMHWGDTQLAETLPIAAFLTRRLAPSPVLDELALARLDMVCSASAMDVTGRLAHVIWASLAFPGSQPEAVVQIHGPGVLSKLECLDALYPEGRFLGGEQPAPADFFAAEALDGLAYILPAERSLAGRLPGLTRLEEKLSARAQARGGRAARPAQLTGCPIEGEVVERLRKVDWLPE